MTPGEFYGPEDENITVLPVTESTGYVVFRYAFCLWIIN